ncbi:MAG: tetraacyldisaccharide 4'-kinase [Candidatus Rokuibacteriota bacterium]
MRREDADALLTRGWDRGFAPAPALVLGALAGGYRRFLGTRDWLYARGILTSRGLDCGVVSVGNLTVGGTGKTPAVELAVHTLAALGRRAAVVSRGYRRRSRGVQVVADTAAIRLDAEDAGDEPFLLARRLPGVPVVVGASRYQAARLAVERFGVDAVVIDDGFQHRTLDKDLEIVMARAQRPWGNGRLLPGGPLREPLRALARADLVVAVGAEHPGDAAEVADTIRHHAPGVPVLPARYVAVECLDAGRMRIEPVGALGGTRLLAFAGIASPAAFEATCTGLGVRLVDSVSFADHHWYTRDDMRRLGERARALGAAGLVTTEKDWVRLRGLPLPPVPLYVITIRLELLAGAETWRRAFEKACPTR